MPKVATRSTRDALLIHHYPKIIQAGLSVSQKNQLAVNHTTYHCFSSLKKMASRKKLVVFYRDHEERVRSCWRQKVASGSSPFYFWMYYPLLRRGMSEERFIYWTSRLEPFFPEKHFENYSRIYDISGLDVKKLEDFDNFFESELGYTVKSNVTA